MNSHKQWVSALGLSTPDNNKSFGVDFSEMPCQFVAEQGSEPSTSTHNISSPSRPSQPRTSTHNISSPSRPGSQPSTSTHNICSPSRPSVAGNQQLTECVNRLQQVDNSPSQVSNSSQILASNDTVNSSIEEHDDLPDLVPVSNSSQPSLSKPVASSHTVTSLSDARASLGNALQKAQVQDNSPVRNKENSISMGRRLAPRPHELIPDNTVRSQSVKKMMKVRSKFRTFRCHICLAIFLNREALASHIDGPTHSGRTPTSFCVCPYCYIPVAGESLLKMHLDNSHTDELKRGLIRYDGKTVGISYGHLLKKEMMAEMKPGDIFACQACDQDFDSFHMMHHHVFNKHKSMTVVVCRLCQEKLEPMMVGGHDLMHNGVANAGSYICNCFDGDLASAFFIISKNEEEDVQVAISTSTEDEAVFKCKFCSYEHKNVNRIKSHINVHLEARPAKCNICGEQLRNTSDVYSHYLQHNSGTANMSLDDLLKSQFFQTEVVLVPRESLPSTSSRSKSDNSFKAPTYTSAHIQITSLAETSLAETTAKTQKLSLPASDLVIVTDMSNVSSPQKEKSNVESGESVKASPPPKEMPSVESPIQIPSASALLDQPNLESPIVIPATNSLQSQGEQLMDTDAVVPPPPQAGDSQLDITIPYSVEPVEQTTDSIKTGGDTAEVLPSGGSPAHIDHLLKMTQESVKRKNKQLEALLNPAPVTSADNSTDGVQYTSLKDILNDPITSTVDSSINSAVCTSLQISNMPPMPVSRMPYQPIPIPTVPIHMPISIARPSKDCTFCINNPKCKMCKDLCKQTQSPSILDKEPNPELQRKYVTEMNQTSVTGRWFQCSMCTFRTQYCIVIERHVLYHEPIRPSIADMKYTCRVHGCSFATSLKQLFDHHSICSHIA